MKQVVFFGVLATALVKAHQGRNLADNLCTQCISQNLGLDITEYVREKVYPYYYGCVLNDVTDCCRDSLPDLNGDTAALSDTCT